MDNRSQPMLMARLIKDPVCWDLLMDYVAVEKDRLVNQLLKCKEEELKGIQGEIKALSKLESLQPNLKAEEAKLRRTT